MDIVLKSVMRDKKSRLFYILMYSTSINQMHHRGSLAVHRMNNTVPVLWRVTNDSNEVAGLLLQQLNDANAV